MSFASALHGVGSVIYGKFLVSLPVPTSTPQLGEATIIVTGANTGLGFESCKHLFRLGAGKLIVASSIDVWSIDVDDYSSIEACTARASELPRLDGVLANAGLMTIQLTSSNNNEKNLHVNVISTFLLYLHLLPKIRESTAKTGNPCRFSIPNSALHYVAQLDELRSDDVNIIDRLNDPEKSSMLNRYNLTKLLVIYAVREFTKRTESREGTCIINTPNPSFRKSGLAKESAESAGFAVFESVMARSTEEGSRALVNGILSGPETNGQYLTNCKVQVPACHVTNDWGRQFQKRFVDNLISKLEEVHPGISSNT
ncbi:NAD(P)-binding protein [Xylariaceae sp. FL1272]|nr:NAD(P)-binding protein [Xylariaceae sp. FL1272]